MNIPTINDKYLMAHQVAKWNEDRYGLKFDKLLSDKLMAEEYHELLTAESVEETLDAIGDITFVYIGIMAKVNGFINPDFADSIDKRIKNIVCLVDDDNSFCTSNATSIMWLMRDFIRNYICPTEGFMIDNGVEYTSHLKFHLHDFIFMCLERVIKSNNTKDIVKTDANVKANSNNKGSGYIEPDFSDMIQGFDIVTSFEELHELREKQFIECMGDFWALNKDKSLESATPKVGANV